jgi:septum site-determining protein MinD
MTTFIGIISSKGGVGKTTATINLSGALHFFNRNVIALDGNLSNPDIGVHLGITKPQKTVHSAIRGDHHIRHSVHVHQSGLKVVPGSIGYKDARQARPENLITAVTGLTGMAEAVIIDSAPGIGADAQAVIKASQYILVITTPDLVAVTDSLKAVRLAQDLGKTVLGAIVNRQRGHGFEMAIPNIEEFLGVPVIGVIPNDEKLRNQPSTRMPLVLSEPNSAASIGYKKIAGQLIGTPYEETVKREDDVPFFRQFMRNLGFEKI